MIALDTNILIRYMVQDDPRQSKAAARLIETKCSAASPTFINLIVLCELTWVLSTSYRYTRKQIASALRQLLLTECFEFESHELAWTALREYTDQNCGYADCLLAQVNARHGAETTFTLDRKAGKGRHYTLLQR